MTVDDSDAREAAGAQAGPTLGLRRNAPASRPEPACNPDRLWYLAQAAGLDAPSPEVARIIELGCGEGGNLLPLAYRLPTATITGVDEDPERLGVAHGDGQTLSLGGLELHATSPMRFEGGPFDYVLAPDLLFRPNATAEPLLAQLSTLLAPTGVAFLRYPTPDGRSDVSSRRCVASIRSPGSGPGSPSPSRPSTACRSPSRSPWRRPPSWSSRRPIREA